MVRPRRLVKFGISPEELPEVGVFATDSPHRPNPPIGLSIVRLVGRMVGSSGFLGLTYLMERQYWT